MQRNRNANIAFEEYRKMHRDVSVWFSAIVTAAWLYGYPLQSMAQAIDPNISETTSVTEESDTADDPAKANPDPTEAATLQSEVIETAALGETDEMMLDMGLVELLNTPVEVWTATKSKTTLEEAPSIITVVTADDIRRNGYQSIADVLKQVPGFYMVDDHIIPNVGIRGISGSFNGESGLIKVLVDGVNVAFRSTGGNWLGPELIPLSIVKRIEIIRGPASALYGADAFLGVINIMTFAGEDFSGASVIGSGQITAFQEYGGNFDLTVGTLADKLEVIYSVRINRDNRSGLRVPDSSPAPRIPSYNEGDDVASGMNQDSYVVYGRVGYRLNEHLKIRLVGSASRIERGGEFASWSQLSDGQSSSGHDRGTTVSLQKGLAGLQLSFEPTERLSVAYSISYQSGKPNANDKIDVGSDLYYVRRDFGYKVLESNLEMNWKIHDTFTGIVGGEFSYDWENLPSSLRILRATVGQLDAGEVMESSSTRQGKNETYNVGALAQGIWTGLAPYLSLTGGIRFDNHSLYGNQISGRAGIISSPHKVLHLKFLYGNAFKAPSPLLLHGVPNNVGDIIGNPDLKPQKVHTFEAQVTLKPSKYFSVSTGSAYSMLKDKAEFVQRGINRVAANISEMKSISWESEAAFMYEEWIRAHLGFDYLWTTRKSQTEESLYLEYLMGNQNEIYPEYIGRASITLRIPGLPAQATSLVRYVGPRPSSAMNTLENLGRYELPSYLMIDAIVSTVGLTPFGNRETVFSVIGRNLTNKVIADPGYAGIDYPLLPLTVLLQIEQQI